MAKNRIKGDIYRQRRYDSAKKSLIDFLDSIGAHGGGREETTKIWREGGSPYIKTMGADQGAVRSHFNPQSKFNPFASDTMYVHPVSDSTAPYLEFFGEIAHGKQFKNKNPLLLALSIYKSAWDKGILGDDVYNKEGSLENRAHFNIQPELIKRVKDAQMLYLAKKKAGLLQQVDYKVPASLYR